MRRGELFKMKVLSSHKYRPNDLNDKEVDIGSYFSCMEPEDFSPNYNRRKGASVASKARR